ncbi:MAG: membrane protein insertase YidC [Deltaproteobacteria bacterium]
MDRRTLLFFAISAAILLLYQEFVLNPMMPAPGVEVAAPANITPAPDSPRAAPAATRAELAVLDDEPLGTLPVAAAKLKGQTILLETDLYLAKISTLGGRVESFQLKNFRETSAADSPLLELVVPAPEIELPLGIELRGARVWTDASSIYKTSDKSLRVSGTESRTLVLRTSLGGKNLEKHFTIQGDAYTIGLKTRVPDATALPASLSQDGPDGSLPTVALVLTRGAKPIEEGTIYEGTAALVDDKLEETARDDLEEPETLRGAIGWAGFEDHYFLTAAAPDRASAVLMRRRGATSLQTRILTPRNASGPTDVDYTLYFGPKERATLDEAGHGFSKALNLGWFGPISLLLLDLLQFLHRFSANWGVDIILLTVVVKGIFWPLTKKSFDSMRAMQKLQPEMARIKEKYPDDQQKQSQETMELYKRHKVNPLGGCLPMVLQMPVFFGLYQLLQNTIELRHAPFALWITDLAAPERLQVFGYAIPVLTIVLGASMFLQQKMTPSAADPTQQRIMMLMPLVFTFMFINFPAGLTLYWLTQNILTIGQQWLNLRKPA